MPGPTPKDPARRQRTHKGDPPKADLSLLPGQLAAPKPPAGLSKAWRDEWTEFWRSDISKAVTAEAIPALRRLFSYRDELARLSKLVEDEPFVEGSQGQSVANPYIRRIDTLERQVLALEDRFGLNPKARLMLGATMADTARSLDDLNARYRGKKPDDRPAPLDLATS